MSLTSHLEDQSSPIGQFLRTRFAKTVPILRSANPHLRTLTTLRPQVVPGDPYPYREIGRAIDYRIRYSFAVTPWRDLVAAEGAYRLPFWADNPSYTSSLIDGFAERLDTTIADIRPAERILSRYDEVLLARYCYVLGLFENVFRSGTVADALAEALYPAQFNVVNNKAKGRRPNKINQQASEAETEACVAQLLASVADNWANDVASLGMLATDRLGAFLSQPANLNPTFAGSADVGGADADLIMDRCLVELKASVQPALVGSWLQQLAGYVLLDYDDEHHLDSVGVYMVRQGELVRWPLDEFLQTLTGDFAATVADLRREFHTIYTAIRDVKMGAERTGSSRT